MGRVGKQYCWMLVRYSVQYWERVLDPVRPVPQNSLRLVLRESTLYRYMKQLRGSCRLLQWYLSIDNFFRFLLSLFETQDSCYQPFWMMVLKHWVMELRRKVSLHISSQLFPLSESRRLKLVQKFLFDLFKTPLRHQNLLPRLEWTYSVGVMMYPDIRKWMVRPECYPCRQSLFYQVPCLLLSFVTDLQDFDPPRYPGYLNRFRRPHLYCSCFGYLLRYRKQPV